MKWNTEHGELVMGPVYCDSPSLCDRAWTMRAVNWHEDQDPQHLEGNQGSGFSGRKSGRFALCQVSWATTVSQSSCPCIFPGPHGPQWHFTGDYGGGREAAAYSLMQCPVGAHRGQFSAGSLRWCRQLLPGPSLSPQAPGPDTCLAHDEGFQLLREVTFIVKDGGLKTVIVQHGF